MKESVHLSIEHFSTSFEIHCRARSIHSDRPRLASIHICTHMSTVLYWISIQFCSHQGWIHEFGQSTSLISIKSIKILEYLSFWWTSENQTAHDSQIISYGHQMLIESKKFRRFLSQLIRFVLFFLSLVKIHLSLSLSTAWIDIIPAKRCYHHRHQAILRIENSVWQKPFMHLELIRRNFRFIQYCFSLFVSLFWLWSVHCSTIFFSRFYQNQPPRFGTKCHRVFSVDCSRRHCGADDEWNACCSINYSSWRSLSLHSDVHRNSSHLFSFCSTEWDDNRHWFHRNVGPTDWTNAKNTLRYWIQWHLIGRHVFMTVSLCLDFFI